MNFKLSANVNGITKTIDVIVDSLKDVNEVLSRFGKYLRLKAGRKFSEQGPGWSELKKSSVTRKVRASRTQLEKKLKKELAKAETRAATDKIVTYVSPGGQSFQILKKQGTQKSVDNKRAILEEFKRLESGGSVPSGLNEKKEAKLKERISRADAKGKRILGNLSNSIKASVSKGTLIIRSEVPWSAVHNDGGSAGHGAQLPKREFLAVDEEDLDILESFLLEHIESKLG